MLKVFWWSWSVYWILEWYEQYFENIGEYNPNEKHKILIVFDEMVAGLLSDKELSPVATDVFISGRKLNTYLAFIKQSYFAAPKNVRLNSTH